MTPRARELRHRMYIVWAMTAVCVLGWMASMTRTAASASSTRPTSAFPADVRGVLSAVFFCLALLGVIASLWVIGDYNYERVAPTEPNGFDVIQ